MMITYWCAPCRLQVSAPGACPQCQRPLALRATRDDPDDPRYGTPRCPICGLEFDDGSRSCQSCEPSTSWSRSPL